MLPILYESNTTDFNNNGLGFIKNCTKCKVVEVRNGLYELELEMLTNDRLAGSIADSMFLKAKANPHDKPQIFEIYQMSVTNTKITAKGQHLKYIAGGNVLGEAFDSLLDDGYTPEETWNRIQRYLEFDNLFEFYSDITTRASVTAGKECPIRLGDFLSGVDGSMLDTFHGEFHYDNFTIELLKNRGTDTGIAIRYGSNISSYQQDSDSSTVYSHLLPYAIVKAEDYDTGKSIGDKMVYASLIDLQNSNLTYKRALAYEFSDEFTGDDDIAVVYQNGVVSNWNDLTTKLNAVAAQYVNKNYAALTEISVNITVDVAETLKNLENCKLCDTVQVYFEPLGFSASAKIVKTEYDVLLEKYTKIELGTIKKTIADLFSGRNIGGA